MFKRSLIRIVLSALLIGALAAHLPPVTSSQDEKAKTVRVPKGTPVELEISYDVSSATVEKGDAISLRAVNPVKVDGVTIIASGALSTALIVKVKRRRHWGRAGQLAWQMRDIVAVDEQQIPLQFGRQITGEGKRGEVATKAIATGILFWPIAPVALLWGFKKGKNAVIPAGKRFEAVTSEDVVVRTVPASN